MTFLAEETSIEGGAPVELYEFVVGGDLFFFTTGEDEITIASTTYTPTSIRRSEILVGPEQRTDIVSVEVPAENPFAKKYVDIVPGSKASLTIKRVHRFDTTDETIVMFKGVVRSVAFTREGTQAQIAVIPLTGGMSRSMPRFHYSSLCNHVLYDSRCKVIENDFRFQGTVSVISGNDITVPGVGASVANPATAGFVRVGNVDFRLVLSQATDVLTLLLPFPSSLVSVGTAVDVFAGCDHTIQVCKSQFNIVVNFGGYAFVPLRNPFESGLV